MRTIISQRTALALGSVALFTGAPTAFSQSQDALLDKLVSKGILTQNEANELKDEADAGFRKSYQAKTGLPDWVSSLRFNGDFRGRYDGIYSSKAVERHRFRYRLRFGFVANMADDFEVGFRLGSGEASVATPGFIDPISSNQTFQDNGAKKGIFIDLAYAKWSPVNDATWGANFTVGKMENPFVFSDNLFDPDYTPEGVAAQLRYSINDMHSLRLIGGAFMLDELAGSSRDPFLLGAQARWDGTWNSKKTLLTSAGIGVLAIQRDQSLGNGTVPNINLGNTRTAAGLLQEGFNPWVADASITYILDSFPMYTGPFPVKLAGDFTHNPAADSNNEGYSVGVTLGKAGKRKTWELSYRLKELQSDVWYEELTDSDTGAFYFGDAPLTASSGRTFPGYHAGTNLRGHVIKAAYSPTDTITLGLTFAVMNAINEVPIGTGSTISRLILDAVWKF